MVKVTLESEMEEQLINELCSGVSQWTRREDIKNENDLWNNLREKLNRNNIVRCVMVKVTLESEMEEQLINVLCSGVSQWTRREDIKNENDLWNNLREKLNRNNIDRLEGIPLTDGEMAKVKEFLLDQCTSTYKAARWLSGEHQVAQIPLLRDDASLGQVSLIAINNREIAGGLSSYEVIHQYNAPKDEQQSRDCRWSIKL